MENVDRIIFLITSLDFGGAQAQVVPLAIQLSKANWAVSIVSMLAPQAFTSELCAAGVMVKSLDMKRGLPNPGAIAKLARYIREFQPQIVHSHLVHANLLARVTRIIAPVPVLISTIHNISEGRRWREICYRMTDRWCEVTTSISQAALERYVRIGAVPAEKILLLPNSVDIDRFYPNEDWRLELRQQLNLVDKFVWLAVGRLEKQKDYPNMLQAFALVVHQRPDAHLIICGKGPLEEALKMLAEQLKIPQNVHFLGIRQDIPKLMNAADSYLMSSAWEGMPVVLLEASASGLPTVATDVGGNREVISQGESGLLVTSKNHEALASAMQDIINMPLDEREKMGTLARKNIIESYSFQVYIDKWKTLYKQMKPRKTQ
ncbi:MAG: glycosyltransferase [Cyanobacteria bacterium J06639_16]